MGYLVTIIFFWLFFLDMKITEIEKKIDDK